MIVITGAAGFIGSCMVRHLNAVGRGDLLLVDDFTAMEKLGNLENTQSADQIPRDLFFDWAALKLQHISFIIHLGAEMDSSADEATMQQYNLEFSQRLWSLAAKNRIPLLFAASSTGDGLKVKKHTMSAGESGDVTAMERSEELKQRFDTWVLKQSVLPPLWAGFSMPEVYGPQEQHKGMAASSVFQAFQQYVQKGKITVPFYGETDASGQELLTDRIFVKDVVTILTWFMNHLPASGFYSLTTGYPRPLSAVAKAIYSALKKNPEIEFLRNTLPIEMNVHLEKLLPMNSLRKVGYKKKFTPLEQGIRLYMNFFSKKQ